MTWATLFALTNAVALAGWLMLAAMPRGPKVMALILYLGVGLLCLTYADIHPAATTAMVVAYAIIHGTAWGLRGPFMQAIRADYFGRSAIGMILGLSFMIITVGQIGGPMIAGILADMTGNYRAGFTTLALLAGMGSLFFLAARRPERPAAEPAKT